VDLPTQMDTFRKY